MKNKTGNVLVWVAFGIVVLYLLLKILNVIHSPVTIDIIALLSGAYFVGRYAKRIDDSFSDVENIKCGVVELNNKCPIFKDRKIKTR